MTIATLKIEFDEDEQELLKLYVKTEDLYLSVKDFDDELRNMIKYGEVDECLIRGVEYARDKLRESMERFDVHLDMLS